MKVWQRSLRVPCWLLMRACSRSMPPCSLKGFRRCFGNCQLAVAPPRNPLRPGCSSFTFHGWGCSAAMWLCVWWWYAQLELWVSGLPCHSHAFASAGVSRWKAARRWAPHSDHCPLEKRQKKTPVLDRPQRGAVAKRMHPSLQGFCSPSVPSRVLPKAARPLQEHSTSTAAAQPMLEGHLPAPATGGLHCLRAPLNASPTGAPCAGGTVDCRRQPLRRRRRRSRESTFGEGGRHSTRSATRRAVVKRMQPPPQVFCTPSVPSRVSAQACSHVACKAATAQAS